MLSLGWTEIFIIGAIALIVVGPKDLPAMLRNLGRVAGTVKRMGNEFRQELNKAVPADEVRDLKNSISNPIKKASADITRDFNKVEGDKTVPSGAIKPKDPSKESVVDEIREMAGMNSETAKATKASTDAAMAEAVKPVAATGAVQKPAAKKADTAAASAPAKKPAAKKPAAKKPAAKKPAAKKPAAKKAPAKAAAATTDTPAPKPARAKPAARKPATRKPTTKAPAEAES